jgi:hypothetical protein
MNMPRRFAPVAFGFILSGLMSLLVSGISTLRATHGTSGWAGLWLGSWLLAWSIAFPAVLVAAPVARKVVDRLMAAGAARDATSR